MILNIKKSKFKNGGEMTDRWILEIFGSSDSDA